MFFIERFTKGSNSPAARRKNSPELFIDIRDNDIVLFPLFKGTRFNFQPAICQPFIAKVVRLWMDKVSISFEKFSGCSVIVTNPQQQIPGGDGLRVHLLVSVESKKSVGKGFEAGLRSLCVGVLEEIPRGGVSRGKETWEGFLVT